MIFENFEIELLKIKSVIQIEVGPTEAELRTGVGERRHLRQDQGHAGQHAVSRHSAVRADLTLSLV